MKERSKVLAFATSVFRHILINGLWNFHSGCVSMGQADLTFKLDFPGNLYRAAFVIIQCFKHLDHEAESRCKIMEIIYLSHLVGNWGC